MFLKNTAIESFVAKVVDCIKGWPFFIIVLVLCCVWLIIPYEPGWRRYLTLFLWILLLFSSLYLLCSKKVDPTLGIFFITFIAVIVMHIFLYILAIDPSFIYTLFRIDNKHLSDEQRYFFSFICSFSAITSSMLVAFYSILKKMYGCCKKDIKQKSKDSVIKIKRYEGKQHKKTRTIVILLKETAVSATIQTRHKKYIKDNTKHNKFNHL